jgi:hypothetical protein
MFKQRSVWNQAAGAPDVLDPAACRAPAADGPCWPQAQQQQQQAPAATPAPQQPAQQPQADQATPAPTPAAPSQAQQQAR